MLWWFIRFTDFAKFPEFHLEKSPLLIQKLLDYLLIFQFNSENFISCLPPWGNAHLNIPVQIEGVDYSCPALRLWGDLYALIGNFWHWALHGGVTANKWDFSWKGRGNASNKVWKFKNQQEPIKIWESSSPKKRLAVHEVHSIHLTWLCLFKRNHVFSMCSLHFRCIGTQCTVGNVSKTFLPENQQVSKPITTKSHNRGGKMKLIFWSRCSNRKHS